MSTVNNRSLKQNAYQVLARAASKLVVVESERSTIAAWTAIHETGVEAASQFDIVVIGST